MITISKILLEVGLLALLSPQNGSEKDASSKKPSPKPKDEKAESRDDQGRDDQIPGEVVARIGDHVITQREIIAILKHRAKGRRPVSEARLLIDVARRSLLRHHSQKLGVNVSDEIVEKRFERHAQNFGGVEVFVRDMEEEGYDVGEFKEQIRDQLIFVELSQDRLDIHHRARATPDEIRKFWWTEFERTVSEPDTVELVGIRARASELGDNSKKALELSSVVAEKAEANGLAELRDFCSTNKALTLQEIGRIPLDDSGGYIAPIIEFAETRPVAGDVSYPIRLGNGDFLVLKCIEFHEGRTETFDFDDPRVQAQIRGTVEDRKWRRLQTEYLRGIAKNYEIWPPGLAEVFTPRTPRLTRPKRPR